MHPYSPPFTFLAPIAVSSLHSKDKLKDAVEDCLAVSPAGVCPNVMRSPIGEWDVSNITDMYGIFSKAKLFNQDVSKWDVSKVTNIFGMFYSAESFNQDVSKWDVSEVTDMGGMFFQAESFNQDVSNWDVSKVTSMIYMFFYTTNFNHTLRGNAWLCSKADKSLMFQSSGGSISDAECGG